MDLKRIALVAVMALQTVFLTSCGGGGSGQSGGTPTPPPPPATDISVLMFGNSHTSNNNLPGMLSAMLKAGRPGKTVSVVKADGLLFLDQRFNDALSLNLLTSQHWGAVVFQAQRYSASGTVQYSIAEAVALVKMARSAHSMPVMFPEWPRVGIRETAIIYQAYKSIADLAPACVPPIPHAFDLAAIRFPLIVLHAGDGNHSSPAGAFLAALILYATMTGNSPLGLPHLPGFGSISELTQQQLRMVADEQLILRPPRLLCPGEVVF